MASLEQEQQEQDQWDADDEGSECRLPPTTIPTEEHRDENGEPSTNHKEQVKLTVWSKK